MDANTVSFSVYDPNGIRVTFVLPLDDIASVQPTIARVLAGGFTANVAGAAPGETVEEVGFVSRREKSDGTPVLDLFSPNEMLAHRVFAHYLDTPEMIADFENATGLKLDEIPVWIAEQPIKKTSNTWKQYGVQTRRVARIALKDNPKHDPNETDVSKKKPKHLFSQWLPALQPTEPNRHMALIDRDGRPTQAQPANPTPASSSASTAGTGTGDGASREMKVVNGSGENVLDEAFGKREGVTQWTEVQSIQRTKGDKGEYYRLKCEYGQITAFSTTALNALGIDTAQCLALNKIYPLHELVRVPYFEKVIERNGVPHTVLELDHNTAKAQLEESA